MPSDLQVSNIKDLTGSNTGLSIASDGQITVNQNNPTITLGSNTTFPDSIKNTPAFQAKVPTTVTITRNAYTVVPFSTEVFDTNSAYTNTAGNYKFTVPSGHAGKYAFQVNIEADDNGQTWARCALVISLNGSVSHLFDQNQVHGQNISMSGAIIQDLSVGDYVQVLAYLVLSNTNNDAEVLPNSFFSGFKLIGV